MMVGLRNHDGWVTIFARVYKVSKGWGVYLHVLYINFLCINILLKYTWIVFYIPFVLSI